MSQSATDSREEWLANCKNNNKTKLEPRLSQKSREAKKCQQWE